MQTQEHVIINKEVSADVIKDLCTRDTIDRQYILDLIGNKMGGQQYSPHTEVEILPDYGYAKGKNTATIKTTLGCLIVNKVLFEDLFTLLGYQNKVMDAKFYYGIMEILNAALIEDRITPAQYMRFADMREAFSNSLNAFFTPTPTLTTFTPPKEVLKLRDELLKKYEKELADGDEIVASMIEKELLKASRDYLEGIGDQGMELYDSGAKSSFNNNYKARLFNGPVMDPNTGKFHILTSNYYEGTNKKDIPLIASSMVAAAYAKGVGTAVGGYAVKQANAAFQSIVFDNIGSDCGTDKYVMVDITKNNYKDYFYRYFIVGNDLVMMTIDNKDMFIGRRHKLRDASVCKSDKTCSKCSGEYLQKIDIQNAGLTTTTPYNCMVNRGMKKFHDTSVKVYTLDNNALNDILMEVYEY